jgi:hypothetical protein
MKEQFDIEKEERDIKIILLSAFVLISIAAVLLASMWMDKVDKLLP